MWHKISFAISLLLTLTSTIHSVFSQDILNQMNKKKSYSLLSLGDSYTIGEQLPPDQSFPQQTATILKKNGIIIDPLKIIAVTGWTTDELMNAIKNENISQTFDLVTLLIGVNNQYRGRDTSDYRNEFRKLLEIALSFSGNNPGRVYVLSIPDWGNTPFAEGRNREKIAEEIDDYNEVNKQESLARNIHYIDITDTTRSPESLQMLAGDGLHPSGKMYELWAERLAAMIRTGNF